MSEPDTRISRTEVEGAERAFDVVDHIHRSAFQKVADPYSRPTSLTAGQQYVTVLFAYIGDVENGGFDQCFSNYTGELTDEAIAAARAVGAARHAGLVERAAQIVYPGGVPADREQREAVLAEVLDETAAELEEIEEEMFALDGDPSTELSEVLHAYVRAHPEEFFID